MADLDDTRMSTLLNGAWSYVEETLDQCRARYEHFGIGVFDRLEQDLPELFHRLRYYQATDVQTQDAFAFCTGDHPFGIQLDPNCEVICLWDEATHVEIGTWSPDPEGDAIRFIQSNFR